MTDGINGAKLLHVVWSNGPATAIAEVTSRFSKRDRAVSLAAPGTAKQLPDAERRLYTQGSDLIPVDGIVKETASRITAGAKSDIDKARAIYD